MTPAKESQDTKPWEGSDNSEGVFEKVIGENTLRHISFLARGLYVSRAVALVDVKEWVGTGFMISPCLLVTNNHVLPERSKLANTVFRFNYQLTYEGAEEQAVEYRALLPGLFHTNSELDYTVAELAGNPGDVWSVAPLSSAIPSKDCRVNIIQHPGGLPKQISFQNNFVEYSDPQKIQYVTATLAGSSGAPVFDDDWNVVAVHHAGGMLVEPGTNRKYFRNEGISVAAILNSLPAEIRVRL